MGLDYVGLNQALSSDGGLLGTTANLIARKQDRDLYREQMDRDFSLRGRALGLQESLGNRELDLRQKELDNQNAQSQRKLDIMEAENRKLSDWYDARTGRLNAETKGIEDANASAKLAQMQNETTQAFKNTYTMAANKGVLGSDSEGATTFDAGAFVNDPELFSASVRTLNNPIHAKALSEAIPEAKRDGAMVAVRKVQGEGGENLLQIGIQGKDGKLIPLPGQEDTVMTQDEYVAYWAGTASPQAHAGSRNIVDMVNSMTNSIRGQMTQALNASNLDNQTALAIENRGLSSAARMERNTNETLRVKEHDPSFRVANRKADNMLADDTLGKLELTAEAQYKNLIKDKGGLFKIGKSAADTLTSPGKFAQAMRDVYYGNQGKLQEMGLPEELADYTPRHHQQLAEITAAVHKNDDAWPEILKYWGPGLMANALGFMDPKRNNSIDGDVKEAFSLRQAKY